jgi:hypothetical protein
MSIKASTPQQSILPSSIKTSASPSSSINFTNSNLNTEYKPIQKSPQELKM